MWGGGGRFPWLEGLCTRCADQVLTPLPRRPLLDARITLKGLAGGNRDLIPEQARFWRKIAGSMIGKINGGRVDLFTSRLIDSRTFRCRCLDIRTRALSLYDRVARARLA